MWKAPLYILSQILGGFLGGALNYGLWAPVIRNFEAANNITRGSAESDITASLGFGVFPFPAAQAGNKWPSNIISPGQAMFIEAFGTGLLCFIVFMILDSRNETLKDKGIAPMIIGLSIGAMISILSPMTTGCFNPARDFGPRLFGALAGWGWRAFPGKDNGFWVYLVGPPLGAVVAGAIYDFCYSPAYCGTGSNWRDISSTYSSILGRFSNIVRRDRRMEADMTGSGPHRNNLSESSRLSPTNVADDPSYGSCT